VKILIITKDNEFLLSADKNATIVQWTIRDHQMVREFAKYFNDGITGMALSFDGVKAIVTLANSSLKVFPLAELLAGNNVEEHLKKKRQLPYLINYGSVYNGAMFNFAMSQDSEHFFTVSSNGHLRKLSMGEKKMIRDYGQVTKSEVSGLKLFE
jgi:hypothetical protein